MFKVKDIIINGLNIKHKTAFYNLSKFEGIIPNLERRHRNTKSQYIRDWIDQYMSQIPCPLCKGMKLNNSSLSVLIDQINIIQLTQIYIDGEIISNTNTYFIEHSLRIIVL